MNELIVKNDDDGRRVLFKSRKVVVRATAASFLSGDPFQTFMYLPFPSVYCPSSSRTLFFISLSLNDYTFN